MSDEEEDDCEELPEGLVQRRAAFDIGSGATKLMIADVDVETGQLGDIVHASERTVKYALDWKTHGVLSDAVQAEGIKVLHALRTEVLASGCTAYTAVATEVFRKAPNGAAFLQRVRAELGLEIALVSQQEEAQIGFLTAVAVGRRGRAATIAWDSGGGSFQFSCEATAGAPSGLRTYVGALGASVVAAAMIEHVQKRSLAETTSPNPASRDEAQQLVAHCRAQLETPPPWLRGAALATAIGGANSIFRCVEQVTHDLNPAAAAAAAASGLPGRFGVTAVRAALESCCGQTDAALAEKGHVEAAMVVPKLCLLLAVLEACELQEFECAELCPQP